MHLSSVCVLLLSCILLLSPLSASPLLPIHNSQSNTDSGISLSPPIDGFQPPDSPDLGENFVEPPPPPPPYLGDMLGSPPVGAPNNGNTDLSPSPPIDVLPESPQFSYVPPPSMPIDDATPPTSDTPLPTPQLPIILSPPSDNSLPLSPFASPPPDSLPLDSPPLPFASTPPDSSLPDSPQLPLASTPPSYNILPGSPPSPLPYHHPKDTQPETSMAPAPFGVYPSGQNQGQQFGQAYSGLFGQQQNSNGVPFGGQYGGCGSTTVDLIRTATALIGLWLISWV